MRPRQSEDNVDSYKNEIEKIVRDYLFTSPSEFETFSKGLESKKEKQRTKWAELKTDGVIERLLFEIPETLHRMLENLLSDEAITWYKTKEGARWFTNRFSQFRVTEKA